ncbi:hypothetical protein N2152v2_001236 [Parachlorella kessleri]
MESTALRERQQPASAPPVHEQPRRWPVGRRLKGCLSQPAVTAAVGAVLMAVGVACLVVPFATHLTSHHHSPPEPAAAGAAAAPAAPVDPFSALPSSGIPTVDGDSGSLYECKSAQLQDPQKYAAAAAAAENATFGVPIATLLASGAAQSVLDGLPQLRIPVLFWVLHSASHRYSPRFPAAVATQTALLNAAFHRGGIQFELAGMVPIATSDEVVEGCGGDPSDPAVPAAAVGRLLSDTATTVNVVVCKPEDVHGATGLLDSGNSSGSGSQQGDSEDGSGSGVGGAQDLILLRRAALWLSRTTIVHQVPAWGSGERVQQDGMGHYLGLAHPFPARESCREDGDFLADTPRQFAPDSGCDLDAGMNVCEGEDGPLPVFNFMDLTNDTCRRQFTLGQLARMRAMVQQYRPQLYQAAARGYHLTPVPVAGAFQSGLPPLAVIQAQQQAAVAAGDAGGGTTREDSPGSSNSGSSSSSSGVVGSVLQVRLEGLASSQGQAELAATGQLGTEPQQSACLGRDAQNRTLWVGQLDGGAAWVDAFRILRRGAPGAGSPSSCVGGSGQAGDGAGLLCPGQLPALRVELRVGYSPDPGQNARCTATAATLSQPLQLVECQAPLQGRVVSLEVLGVQQQPAGEQPPPCICSIQPLSFLEEPAAVWDAPEAAMPGSRLSPTGWWQASQSSSVEAAALALAGPTAAQEEQEGDGPDSSGGREAGGACSATAAELKPWWALDLGLDAVAVRGVRLLIPSSCPAALASAQSLLCGSDQGCSTSGGSGGNATAGCTPAPAVKLTVLVGPSLELLMGLHIGSTIGSRKGSGQYLCAANLGVAPGRLVDVDCRRALLGTAVLVRAEFKSPAPLELCSLELVGSPEVQLGAGIVSPGQQAAAQVEPALLQPLVALPVDGDSSTCLTASLPGSSWSLPLQGLHRVLAVSITGAGSNVTASLLDGAGTRVWSAVVGSPPDAGVLAAEALLEVNTSTPVKWLSIRAWSRLCEVRVFAESPGTAAYPLGQAGPAGSATPATNSSSSSSSAPDGRGGRWRAVDFAGQDADAVADGDYRMCHSVADAEAPWLLLLLGGSYRVDEVGLVVAQQAQQAQQPGQNLTLHAIPPGGAATFLAAVEVALPQQQQQQEQQAAAGGPAAAPGLGSPQADADAGAVQAALELAGAQACAAGVALDRWRRVVVQCEQLPSPPVAEALLLGLGRVTAFQAEAAAPTTLSGTTHTHYRLPEGWTQVLAVQVGTGCDLHGQSATKAAERACRHAIEFVDLPCVHDTVPGRYEGIKLKVKVACPNPGMVDLCQLKTCFSYGKLEIEVVEGGMLCSSHHIVPDLGEGRDDMYVAVAAVTVGY